MYIHSHGSGIYDNKSRISKHGFFCFNPSAAHLLHQHGIPGLISKDSVSESSQPYHQWF